MMLYTKSENLGVLWESLAYCVAVGQVAVFYDDGKILGSGFITDTKK